MGASLPIFFFFNGAAPTEIYPLSLHDALPILPRIVRVWLAGRLRPWVSAKDVILDRKSTRLNSSHRTISYAVFCLKKKKKNKQKHITKKKIKMYSNREYVHIIQSIIPIN